MMFHIDFIGRSTSRRPKLFCRNKDFIANLPNKHGLNEPGTLVLLNIGSISAVSRVRSFSRTAAGNRACT